MRNHRHLFTSIAVTLVIGIGSALAQGRPPAPLAVSIAFAGQSAGDKTSTSPLGPLSSRLVPQQAGRGEVRRLADRGEVIQPAGVHHADHH